MLRGSGGLLIGLGYQSVVATPGNRDGIEARPVQPSLFAGHRKYFTKLGPGHRVGADVIFVDLKVMGYVAKRHNMLVQGLSNIAIRISGFSHQPNFFEKPPDFTTLFW